MTWEQANYMVFCAWTHSATDVAYIVAWPGFVDRFCVRIHDQYGITEWYGWRHR
jgi:hypothetical protein